MRLNHLKVTDDGDPWEKGDGDWNFWVGIPVINRPWAKLIGCGGCMEEKTYTPTNLSLGSHCRTDGSLSSDERLRACGLAHLLTKSARLG